MMREMEGGNYFLSVLTQQEPPIEQVVLPLSSVLQQPSIFLHLSPQQAGSFLASGWVSAVNAKRGETARVQPASNISMAMVRMISPENVVQGASRRAPV
jgi:hypothetical protein